MIALPLERRSGLVESALALKMSSLWRGPSARSRAPLCRPALEAIEWGSEQITAASLERCGYVPPSERRRAALAPDDANAELMEAGELLHSIEALLFAASESLSIADFVKLTGASHDEVAQALERIAEAYAQSGIVLREVAGGYRFATPTARVA